MVYTSSSYRTPCPAGKVETPWSIFSEQNRVFLVSFQRAATGEIPIEVQSQLLRVLQEREIVRVGADTPLPVDVRVIAATNRDLHNDVRKGLFREDLYWRLNVVQLKMPPLRARLEDLPLLVDFLLSRVNAECRTTVARVSSGVLEEFRQYAWPGNVRELTNVLRHGAVMAESDVIEKADLPDYLLSPPPLILEGEGLPDGTTLEAVMAATESRLVEATLRRFEGNRKAAAAALGIDRRTLYNKDRGARPTHSRF